jgi:cell shape-determining protein MreC
MFAPLQIPGGPELLIIALNLLLLVAIVAAALSLVRWIRSGGSTGERFGRVEREVGGLEARVDDLDERVTDLEALRDRVDELEQMVAKGEDRE